MYVVLVVNKRPTTRYYIFLGGNLVLRRTKNRLW